MKRFFAVAFTMVELMLNSRSVAQDSLYAKTIDSLWLHSYNTKILSKKRTRDGDAKLEYCYYKSSGKMRGIVSLNKLAKENLLLFFIDDWLVMIWPSGQRPYYILNDTLVYANQMRHTTEQAQSLIVRAYQLLEKGYTKLR